ncbi:FadR/GntR family transcriptional regulator [Gottschalkiaceae bacterium SANA]|nr:FadR/GntR family transcriptional regulator [Gottschalkiaceae bacterium SANA]
MFVQVKNKKVYQHVIEQIQNMVMTGTLKKGDKLPSERDLVEQLGVSRASIREAIRALEMIGLVESRQGEGNFIGGDINSSFFEPLSVMFMLNGGRSEEILELRRVIEVEAVALAAEKITEEQSLELQQLMDQFRTATDETERVQIDKAVHDKIAEIGGNYLILILLSTISSLLETFIRDARGMILREEDNRDLLLAQHQEICDGIIAKDSNRAIEAMKVHLETITMTMRKLQNTQAAER